MFLSYFYYNLLFNFGNQNNKINNYLKVSYYSLEVDHLS